MCSPRIFYMGKGVDRECIPHATAGQTRDRQQILHTLSAEAGGQRSLINIISSGFTQFSLSLDAATSLAFASRYRTV